MKFLNLEYKDNESMSSVYLLLKEMRISKDRGASNAAISTLLYTNGVEIQLMKL